MMGQATVRRGGPVDGSPAGTAWEAPGDTTSGWQAELTLGFERRRDRTVLARRQHRGPLSVQRPFYPEAGGICHTYILHPPAGIVGGDALRVNVALDAGSHALITTPAATRFQWSRAIDASLDQRASVADGATLEWLPQETLVFSGAHARTATRIDLTGSARFIGWEILCLGRPACNETFDDGRLDARFELSRNGRPLLLERLRGDAHGVPGMQGHAATATLMVTDADATALATARSLLDDPTAPLAGATLLGNLLVVRALAGRCEPLLGLFTRLWVALRPLVLGHAGVLPRIWHT